ncbi:MAG: class I SAM-dependent methyltransferase, partial [Candidatus Omnitrophota bacterium]
LKTGGLFIVSTPNQNKLVFNKKDFPFHLRHYTPEEFEELLSRSGFKIRNRVTQYNRESEEVSEGWEGLYNIAVTEKI